jgi:hypothetical protein
VPDDAGVAEKSGDIAGAKARDPLRVEAGKCRAEVLALP